jgi:hypothetical protein
MVKVAQGSQIAVPAWMLDAIDCSQLCQEARPRVALGALLELAALLGTDCLPESRCRSQSGASLEKGTPDASKTKKNKQRTSANELVLRPEGPVGEISRKKSGSLRRTHRATVASRRVKAIPSRKEP